jgi:HSP20 family protein
MSEDKRKELRDVLDELEHYFEGFQKEIEDAVKSNIFGGDQSAWPFVAGFSFNMGPEGRPSLQVFGNNPIRADGFRSPISEQVVDQNNGNLHILLEMPGVEKEDINVEATEDSAVIRAENGEKKYRAELQLQAQVRPESGKAEYKNGMLEISFSLKDKANKGFRRVNVA